MFLALLMLRLPDGLQTTPWPVNLRREGLESWLRTANSSVLVRQPTWWSWKMVLLKPPSPSLYFRLSRNDNDNRRLLNPNLSLARQRPRPTGKVNGRPHLKRQNECPL